MLAERQVKLPYWLASLFCDNSAPGCFQMAGSPGRESPLQGEDLCCNLQASLAIGHEAGFAGQRGQRQPGYLSFRASRSCSVKGSSRLVSGNNRPLFS